LPPNPTPAAATHPTHHLPRLILTQAAVDACQLEQAATAPLAAACGGLCSSCSPATAAAAACTTEDVAPGDEGCPSAAESDGLLCTERAACRLGVQGPAKRVTDCSKALSSEYPAMCRKLEPSCKHKTQQQTKAQSISQPPSDQPLMSTTNAEQVRHASGKCPVQACTAVSCRLMGSTCES